MGPDVPLIYLIRKLLASYSSLSIKINFQIFQLQISSSSRTLTRCENL